MLTPWRYLLRHLKNLKPDYYLGGRCMNKSELIDAAAKRADLSKDNTGKALNALVDTIVETVAKREDVVLVGFGTFKAAERAARQGRNPKTGEPMKISAKTVPQFKAGATFKNAVLSAKKKKK